MIRPTNIIAILLLSTMASAFMVVPSARTTSTVKLSSSVAPAEEEMIIPAFSSSLASVLKKPSKTLSIILDAHVDESNTKVVTSDFSSRSMQLRKLGASALSTSDLGIAQEFVKEQATAQGNFPGPCPVIFVGDDIDAAVECGVSAVAVSVDEIGKASEVINKSSNAAVDLIYKVSSPSDVESIAKEGTMQAFLISYENERLAETLQSIPKGSIVIVSVKSMQSDNKELEVPKLLKELTGIVVVNSILMEKAIVADNEDLEYASFVISGLTKKRSSTFNMSGFTGSTNGHFGGAASRTSTTWLRQKKMKQETQ